jgi:hypothetical protein
MPNRVNRKGYQGIPKTCKKSRFLTIENLAFLLKSTFIMKKGKIILGAAAFIVTSASLFAFKATRSHQSGLFGKTAGGKCVLSTCFTNNALPVAGSQKCLTVNGAKPLATNGSGGYWKATAAGHICTKPTADWTHTF